MFNLFQHQQNQINRQSSLAKPQSAIRHPHSSHLSRRGLELDACSFLRNRFWPSTGHINALAKREYQEGGSSPNFVVLFVPFESILSEALQADELLLQKAFAKNVVIATPTTMLALLRTIRYGYDRQDLAQNAEEIRELAGKLLKRIGKVHEKIEVLGERIKSSERAFNDLVATSENHLMVPARKMIKLGAPSTRSIGEIVDIDSEVRQIKSSAALESSVMNELDFENESSDAE